MQLHKYLPLASDRMGTLWALASIKDACIIEYGPAGTTHYGIEGFMNLNSELRASLYTTHMDENNIVMGDSERLTETIKEVASVYKPPYIFVVASSISSIIGTDIDSICEDLQQEVKAKLIPFTGGGFRGDYTYGIREVLTILAKNVVKAPAARQEKSFNIIGSNADCYNFAADLRELEAVMQGAFGYRLNTVFTANSSIKSIEEAAGAELNIVLRAEGIEAAELLKEKYQMAYIVGAPYGFNGTYSWIKRIEEVLNTKANEIFMAQQMDKARKLLMRFKHATFSYRGFEGLLAGNYDFIADIYPFITSELSINISRAFVNHNLKGKGYRQLPEAFSDRLLVNGSEEAKEALLSEIKPDIILGDGVLLEMSANTPLKLQVSNPNIHHIQIYDLTPFMGFNGATYIIEILLNQIKQKQKQLKNGF